MPMHPADHDLETLERIVERDIDPTVVALITSRLGAVLGVDRERWEPADDRERALAELVDQFAVDVSGVSDAQRTALFAAWGDDAFAVVQAVYILDFQLRRAIVRPLLGDVVPVDTGTVDAPANLALWPAIENYLRTVAQMRAIDAGTAEVVRLRGAAAHQCRICKSRLSLQAIDALGSEEPLVAIVSSRPTELAPRHAAAVRLVDAMVWQPSTLDAATVAELRLHFTDTELHEIVHDIVRNSTNKFAVAVGGDAAIVEDGVEYYDLDASGDVVADVDAAVVRAATSV